MERLAKFWQPVWRRGISAIILAAGVALSLPAHETLAPIRTEVGLRAEANLGHLHHTSEASWIPF